MGKKWITFDLDGTLMQNPFGDWVFPEINSIAEGVLGEGHQIIGELVLEHWKRMDSGLIVDAYNWDDIVEKVFRRHEIPVRVDVEELVKKHSVSPKVYLLEDVVLEVLYGLKEEGFSLAVVTNGFEKYQKPVMDVLGLTKAFDVVITPEKVGYGKPRVEMVECLFDDGDDIVAHVGDRLDHDVVLANELGILSVLVYRDMSDVMKYAGFSKRNRMKECMERLREKWGKETNEKSLPSNAIPKIIIQSVKEINRESLKL